MHADNGSGVDTDLGNGRRSRRMVTFETSEVCNELVIFGQYSFHVYLTCGTNTDCSDVIIIYTVYCPKLALVQQE